jgi:hypothetical protein
MTMASFSGGARTCKKTQEKDACREQRILVFNALSESRSEKVSEANKSDREECTSITAAEQITELHHRKE